MSGGKKDDGSNSAAASPSANVQSMTVPAYFPGQQGLLASQMNAGFGGAPGTGILDMAAYLAGLYQPMVVPMIQSGADVAWLQKNGVAKGTSTQTGSRGTTASSGSSGSSDSSAIINRLNSR